ncbi:MAG: DNA ligase-associated DEXH box helicase [Pseudomonadales bacterium]|nr:DNA ligase-associated DEXH box helicase [Pseudomonadales bacterium]
MVNHTVDSTGVRSVSSSLSDSLLVNSPHGLYCPPGDFYIDPIKPVDRAIITHGHSDHARPGMGHYYCSANSAPLLAHRLGKDISVTPLDYGTVSDFRGVRVSLHPAGHIRGSAQVRVEHDHQCWVVTGDFKRCADPTAEPFEVVECDVLITEATFAVPIYRWRSGEAVAAEIMDWWRGNQATGTTSLLFCYSLGKAQRLLAELGRYTQKTVYAHGAVMPLYRIYQQQGVTMLSTESTVDLPRDHDYSDALVLAPPSAHRSSWMKRFKRVSTGFASGWMQVRGARRRRGYHRGFVLSDHADWPGLIHTVRQTGARQVYTTHGHNEVLARYLREQDIAAAPLSALHQQPASD